MQYFELIPVIDICVSRNIPFGIVAMPGSSDYLFFSSLPDADTGENDLTGVKPDEPYMAISLFDNAEPYAIGIRQTLTPADIFRLGASSGQFAAPDIRPIERSTEAIVYDAQIHEMRRFIRSGKVVLSRIIAGESHKAEVTQVADRFFSQFPDTYRFMYFTQETGLWMGASPELLMSIDTASGRFDTMALAGTRPAGTPGNWDDKNIDEHSYVTLFIKRTLKCIGVDDLQVCCPENLPYGAIEHLCTRFSGTIDVSKATTVLRWLSPTPALGGWPREKALPLIHNYEIHQRHCYGGYVAVNRPDVHSLTAFVNLRCAHLLPNTQTDTLTYNVFTGSGLVSQSKAESEWHETEAKAAALIAALGGTQPDTQGLF